MVSRCIEDETLLTGRAAAPPPTNGSTNNDVEEHRPAGASMRRLCLTNSVLLEPLLMFYMHAIRMRDTRCCSIVLRVFRSILPDFNGDVDPQLANSIREFISSDVLKACITSLNEPYFVELQKDIAYVIAGIIVNYAGKTNTPREILLSLPGMQQAVVDKCIDVMLGPNVTTRQQRALVLDLLGDLKGISISEQGRISKSAATVRKERSKMQQAFMKEHQPDARGQSPSLEGLAGMFG